MRLWTRVFMLLVCSGYLYAQNSAVRSVQQGRPSPLKSVSASGSAKNLVDTALVEWVSHYRSNRASSKDVVHDVIVDEQGNVYVTGKSESAENGFDYLTVKYNYLGEEVWRARYDGPLHNADIANGIAVDGQGNVYVTGLSMGNSGVSLQWGQHDFCTIKYNPAGEEQWVRRYNGSSMWSDAGIAIAVDGAGSVYVVGESWQFDSLSSTHSLDYVTIKYSTNGVTEWVAGYDGPAGLEDSPTSIVTDNSGSVYVTGTSRDSLSMDGIATVKYNADGIEQWVQRRSTSNWNTQSVSVAIDPTLNVLVTAHDAAGLITMKYSPTGQELWTATYAPSGLKVHPCNILSDGSGNVYILAAIGDYGWWANLGDSLVTVKYNADGVLQWTASYSSLDNSLFKAGGVAIAGSGDLYVTGTSGRFDGYYGPFRGDSIVTMKYNSDGIQQWVRRYSGSGNSSDAASAIAVDEGGNVFVAGSSGPDRNSDFLAIKYKPSGIERWATRTSGEGSSHDYVSAMVVDNSGNTYITGSSLSTETSWDYFTAKFNSSGTLMWEARYDGPAGRIDYPHAIAVDLFGNVYITGESEGVGTSEDWTTIKYNAAGAQEWVLRYNGSTGSRDQAYLLELDDASNVYVAGTSNDGARMTIIKYDNSGTQQWISNFDSSGAVGDPSGLSVDSDGNVYVTGYRSGWVSGGSTLKYNSSGILQWRASAGLTIQKTSILHLVGMEQPSTASRVPNCGPTASVVSKSFLLVLETRLYMIPIMAWRCLATMETYNGGGALPLTSPLVSTLTPQAGTAILRASPWPHGAVTRREP